MRRHWRAVLARNPHRRLVKLAAAAAAALFAVASGAAPPPGDSLETRILGGHNAARAQVGAPPLTWDPALAAGAAGWAQYLAGTGQFFHSDRKARRGIGENLWMGTRGAYRIEDMTGMWDAEARNFVPGIFPNNSRTGSWMDIAHYSQVIWPATQRVGCALAAGRSGDVLVCRYTPAGNIDGRAVGYAPAPPALRR